MPDSTLLCSTASPLRDHRQWAATSCRRWGQGSRGSVRCREGSEITFPSGIVVVRNNRLNANNAFNNEIHLQRLKTRVAPLQWLRPWSPELRRAGRPWGTSAALGLWRAGQHSAAGCRRWRAPAAEMASRRGSRMKQPSHEDRRSKTDRDLSGQCTSETPGRFERKLSSREDCRKLFYILGKTKDNEVNYFLTHSPGQDCQRLHGYIPWYSA